MGRPGEAAPRPYVGANLVFARIKGNHKDCPYETT
jgi:hypothetical protein